MGSREYPEGHPLHGWNPYPKRDEALGSLDFMNLETGRLKMAEAPCAGCAALRKALKEVRGDFEVMSSNAAAADAGWTEAQDRATAAEAREARLREALLALAIIEEYDSPGDTPERVGYSCLLCHACDVNRSGIVHTDGCALAEARRGG